MCWISFTRIQSFPHILNGGSDPLQLRTSLHRTNLYFYFHLYSSILFNAHTYTHIQTCTQIFIIKYVLCQIELYIFRYYEYCPISFYFKEQLSMASFYSAIIDILDYFHWFSYVGYLGYPGGAVVKNLPNNAGDTGDVSSIPELGRFSWRLKWQPTPVFLPEDFHAQRSLKGYSPCGCKEADTTAHRAQCLAL